MTTALFAGPLPVHYGFAYLMTEPADHHVDLHDSRRGQVNGLVGAAVAHRLHLVTGLHTGTVTFTVTWSASEPVLDDAWDEVVEASLDIASTEAVLSSFDAFFPLTLPAAGWHRVRYGAAGFAAGKQADAARPGPDRYLLELWPAPAEPDRIIRQTSAEAAYWHGVARDLPAVAPPKAPQPRVEYVIDAETGRYLRIGTEQPD